MSPNGCTIPVPVVSHSDCSHFAQLFEKLQESLGKVAGPAVLGSKVAKQPSSHKNRKCEGSPKLAFLSSPARGLKGSGQVSVQILKRKRHVAQGALTSTYEQRGGERSRRKCIPVLASRCPSLITPIPGLPRILLHLVQRPVAGERVRELFPGGSTECPHHLPVVPGRLGNCPPTSGLTAAASARAVRLSDDVRASLALPCFFGRDLGEAGMSLRQQAQGSWLPLPLWIPYKAGERGAELLSPALGVPYL